MTQKINGISPVQAQTQRTGQTRTKGPASAFGAMLQQELGRQSGAKSVAFSKHAISRAEERGIQVTPRLMEQLEGSVERAQAKGAVNILAMDADRAAFLINVPNARVITAITPEEMKESVFTNIDGAVFLK